MSGSHSDDPAALEAAARELHAIAKKARSQAAALQKCAGKVEPMSQKMQSLIGGSSTGVDKKMAGTLDRAARDLAGGITALLAAGQTAEALAREANIRALRAREAQAVAEPSRRARY